MPTKDDESIQHPRLGALGLRISAESADFPVGGMETVVATVSGYHGSERFNLIKLIARTGAIYVGNMNQCTTHLVCRKFEGRKYELAKKLKIVIVNHRWVEECVKKGRRVSEEPYSFQSGEEMGPLSLDISLRIDQATTLKNKKGHVIDIDFDDSNHDTWADPILSEEDLISQPRKKTLRKMSSNDCPSSSKYCLKTLSRPTELEEANTSVPACSSRRKKNISTSPERHSKGRRLVKKHAREDDLLMEDCKEVKELPHRNSSRILPDGAVVESCQSSSNSDQSDIRFSLSGQNIINCRDNIEEIENVNIENQNQSDRRFFLSGEDNIDARDAIEEFEHENVENQNASVGAISSLPPTSDDSGKAGCEDSVDINPGDALPASNDLSCVICWTDFSSTRGVLPCGHRFCFSCIQNWADHMASARKPSTCPLCKGRFICITKVDDALSSDQKIYSQSIPAPGLNFDLYILPDERHVPPTNQSESVCCRCFSSEPEDLLIWCHFCRVRCIHSYCLDPPLLPWTCIHCKDLQMLYHHSR